MKRFICLFLFCTLSISSTAHAAEIRTVALTGQQVPGSPDGAVFTGFFSGLPVVINDASQTAFFGSATGTTGVWSEGGGSLNVVAALGQQAPGMPDGVTYGEFNNFNARIVIDEAGITAFKCLPSSPSGAGFWSIGPGNSQLLAVSGQQAAGLPDGVRYAISFADTSLLLNDAGQTAFVTNLDGSGVDSSNNQAFWAQRNGSLELVARTGSHAPGTPDGVNFDGFGLGFSPGNRALNNNGQLAFSARLTGSGTQFDYGLWSEGSGSLALVARTGNQAPGMPDGVVFTGTGFGNSSANPALNNSGRTAFKDRVAGPGIDSTNDTGIWSDVTGSLALVVRRGDHAPGTPDGVKFSSFPLNGPALNDAGQLAFIFSLTGAGVDSTNNVGLWSGAPGSLTLVARTGDHAPGTEDGVLFQNFTNSIDFSRGTPTLILNAAGQTAFYGQLTGSGISGSNEFGIWATDRSGVLQLIAREGDPLEVAPGDFRTVAGGFGSLRFNASSGDYSIGNSDGRPSAFNNLGQLAFSARFTDGTSGIFVSNRVAIPEPGTLLLLCFGSLAALWRRRGRRGGRRGTLIATNLR